MKNARAHTDLTTATDGNLSTTMMEALLIVVDHLNQWSMFCDPVERDRVARLLLQQFVTDVAQGMQFDGAQIDHHAIRRDLLFLRVMVQTWGMKTCISILDKAIEDIKQVRLSPLVMMRCTECWR